MRNHEHSEDCVAATARWAPRMHLDADKATATMATVLREAPEDAAAWMACADVSHDTPRRLFKMLAGTSKLAAAAELAKLL